MPLMLTVVSVQAQNQKEMKGSNIKTQELVLTQEWDKTFPQSNKVNHRKVTFVNRYGITLAADLYEPKDAKGALAAIAVSGPFGAVKEQSSGLYAQTMAEQGSIPHLPARVVANLAGLLHRISTRKIFRLPSIFSPLSRMLTRNVSVLSAFADGAVWHLMQLLSTHASRLLLPLQCTT